MPRYEARFDLAGWYLIRRLLRLKRSLPRQPPRLIDLGMGRGRDIIYLARCGFEVSGFDISRPSIERARRRADRLRVEIRADVRDLRTYRLPGKYEVVFSTTALNHLPARLRAARFAHFKSATVRGGLHVVNAFVPPRQGDPPVELEPDERLLRRGELRGYYSDWELLESGEVGFDCLAGPTPHRHSVDTAIARRPE